MPTKRKASKTKRPRSKSSGTRASKASGTTPSQSELPARKVTSSPEAQALAAGLLRGLGEKYQDQELSKAGQILQTQVLTPSETTSKPEDLSPETDLVGSLKPSA